MSEDPDDRPRDITFRISVEDVPKVIAWQENHPCRLRNSKRKGAIGGMFTFIFTNTSIGQIQELECACGKSFLISDDL